MAASEAPDYHALDRLYGLQSEERHERRGLEARATAGIAAALAAVAVALNAGADRLHAARPLVLVFLAVGAALVLSGVLTSTFALVGGSPTTLAVGRAIARALGAVNVRVDGVGIAVSVSRELSFARVEVDDAGRLLQGRLEASEAPEQDAVEARELLRRAGKLLRRLSISAASVRLIEFDALSDAASAPQGADPTAEAEESPDGGGLREPADLDEAVARAEVEAMRLREANSAALLVLRVSSALISIGVFALIAGLVILLSA